MQLLRHIAQAVTSWKLDLDFHAHFGQFRYELVDRPTSADLYWAAESGLKLLQAICDELVHVNYDRAHGDGDRWMLWSITNKLHTFRKSRTLRRCQLAERGVFKRRYQVILVSTIAW